MFESVHNSLTVSKLIKITYYLYICSHYKSSNQHFKSHYVLQEVMAAVASDAKVLAMLTRQRGDKGYRLLQGERLRDLLIKLIAEEVSKSILPSITGVI